MSVRLGFLSDRQGGDEGPPGSPRDRGQPARRGARRDRRPGRAPSSQRLGRPAWPSHCDCLGLHHRMVIQRDEHLAIRCRSRWESVAFGCEPRSEDPASSASSSSRLMGARRSLYGAPARASSSEPHETHLYWCDGVQCVSVMARAQWVASVDRCHPSPPAGADARPCEVRDPLHQIGISDGGRVGLAFHGLGAGATSAADSAGSALAGPRRGVAMRCHSRARLVHRPRGGIGPARFGYAVFLPAMQPDLTWSYAKARGMNTANAFALSAVALAVSAVVSSLQGEMGEGVGATTMRGAGS